MLMDARDMVLSAPALGRNGLSSRSKAFALVIGRDNFPITESVILLVNLN